MRPTEVEGNLSRILSADSGSQNSEYEVRRVRKDYDDERKRTPLFRDSEEELDDRRA